MFRLTGGHLGKHTDLNVIMCTVMPLLDLLCQCAV